MLVHLFHALTALPPWARESYSWLGTQQLGRMHLVSQATLENLKETVQWITTQVTANGTLKCSRR